MLLNGPNNPIPRPSPQNPPFLGMSAPPSNTCFLRLTRVFIQNGISIGSAVSAKLTVECPITLHWDTAFSAKHCPFPLVIGSPSNTWYPEPTRVIIPNGISIGSAVFVWVPNALLYSVLSVGKKPPKLTPLTPLFRRRHQRKVPIRPRCEDHAATRRRMRKKRLTALPCRSAICHLTMWRGRYVSVVIDFKLKSDRYRFVVTATPGGPLTSTFVLFFARVSRKYRTIRPRSSTQLTLPNVDHF